MPRPSADEQLGFLREMQALLEDGQFVATYKYALLIALADISVKSGAEDEAELPIPVLRIAEKFVEYYWQQAAPFPGQTGAVVLSQNTGGQAAVVRRISEARAQGAATLAQLRSWPVVWHRLLADVARTVQTMPLFKLQTISGRQQDFLYPNEAPDGVVRLKPGVAFHRRQFHPLITGLARERWSAQVRRIPANRPALGDGQELDEFLFGVDRQPVAQWCDRLADAQQGECLYCKDGIRPNARIR